jgi:hypothetical protein
VALVLGVEGGEVVEVGEPDGRAHDVGEARAALAERRRDALDDGARLHRDVAGDELAARVHRQHAREEQEAVGADRLRERHGQGRGDAFDRCVHGRISSVAWDRVCAPEA